MINDIVLSILSSLYLPEAIYLKEIKSYSTENKSAVGAFIVPHTHSYTLVEIEYVTAEQYIRCLSQFSNVLVGALIQGQVFDPNFINLDLETYRQLLARGNGLYRRTNIRYKRRISKDTEFELTLTLKRTRIISNYLIFVLDIRGAIFVDGYRVYWQCMPWKNDILQRGIFQVVIVGLASGEEIPIASVEGGYFRRKGVLNISKI